MFKIIPEATFPGSITIACRGVEQKLEVTFKSKTRTQYKDLLSTVEKGEAAVEDVLIQVIQSWDADADLSVESLRLLDDYQPGACWAIVAAYGEALIAERKGN